MSINVYDLLKGQKLKTNHRHQNTSPFALMYIVFYRGGKGVQLEDKA